MKSSILTARPNAKYDVNRDSIPARRAMSKILRPIQLIPAAFVLILQFFTFAAGQHTEISITITKETPTLAKVNGRRDASGEARLPYFLPFMSAYAGVSGIDKRILDLKAFDKDGIELPLERSGAEYHAQRSIESWNCVVDLSPIKQTTAATHLSWLGTDGGIFILDDIIPYVVASHMRGQSARIKFELPDGWKVLTTEKSDGQGVFQVPNLERTVFVVGKGWSEQTISRRGGSINLSSKGDWKFTDSDAAAAITEVVEYYSSLVGPAPSGNNQIVMYKFPFDVQPGEWEADTRGSTVTIASSDMPYKSQSLQRLHEQLRHEIFHLWIPNGVNLTGNYDWFYEGFALYQSLKMGVAVNRIRFDDYLETLSRAYAIDARQSNKTSMIESSRNRWNGSNTDVYARGMLVAFLCDVAMLDASKGKRSTTDLLREIYSKHGREAKPEDGNAAILAIMRRYPELTSIAGRYVTGAEKLEWAELIKAAGFDADAKSGRLSVSAKPSGRQKDLLDKLGYNNWRKLANEKR